MGLEAEKLPSIIWRPHVRLGVIRVVLTVGEPLPVYPISRHSQRTSARLKRANCGHDRASFAARPFTRSAQDAGYFRERAEEGAMSRLWAGIHFRSDIDAGLTLGRSVGQLVVTRAKEDDN
jgi:hypothetical protein